MTDVAETARDLVDAALTCSRCEHRQTRDVERTDPDDTDTFYAADLRYDCSRCGHTNEAAVRITVDGDAEVAR